MADNVYIENLLNFDGDADANIEVKTNKDFNKLTNRPKYDGQPMTSDTDIPAVPTKTSDLENDSGFITDGDIPSKTSDLINDSGFITEDDVPTQLAELSEDSTHRTVTDEEKATWDGKQNAIEDLDDIRSGAEKGETALQPSALNAYRTSAEQDAIDGGKLSEPSSGLAVGKYFRIAEIDENGHAVLEAVDAPNASMKIKIAGTTQTPDADGYVDVPLMTLGTPGVVKIGPTYQYYRGIQLYSGYLALESAAEGPINLRRAINQANYSAITTSNYDLAVRHAMCDNIGTSNPAWTDSQKLGAWTRLSIIKTTLDSVLVPNAQYYLGEQSSLTLTMPTLSPVGAQIIVCFSSGTTACTLVCDLTGFNFVPKENKTNKIVFTHIGNENWIVETEES